MINNENPNYWLVGATWGGVDEKYHDFIAHGYWESGYEKDQKPEQDERFGKMRPGDRIAIKRSLGPSNSDIVIRAIGIISEVDTYARRVYVKWLVRGLSRQVPSKGAYQTIHGPYNRDENDVNWLNSVFSI
jgi:hypothetical protein